MEDLKTVEDSSDAGKYSNYMLMGSQHEEEDELRIGNEESDDVIVKNFDSASNGMLVEIYYD